MAFSINRRGVEDAAPYTRPTDTRRTLVLHPFGGGSKEGAAAPSWSFGMGFSGEGEYEIPFP